MTSAGQDTSNVCLCKEICCYSHYNGLTKDSLKCQNSEHMPRVARKQDMKLFYTSLPKCVKKPFLFLISLPKGTRKEVASLCLLSTDWKKVILSFHSLYIGNVSEDVLVFTLKKESLATLQRKESSLRQTW